MRILLFMQFPKQNQPPMNCLEAPKTESALESPNYKAGLVATSAMATLGRFSGVFRAGLLMSEGNF